MQFIPEGTLYFKLLCPQSITGLIIGRGGSIINQLNANTGAKIKLSQNNEFFPGTNDRILLGMSYLIVVNYLIFCCSEWRKRWYRKRGQRACNKNIRGNFHTIMVYI